MSTPQIPQPPAQLCASELIHGDDAGFLINAYVALQHQWPDEGGFRHYLHMLSMRPGDRLKVLIALAASPTARRSGQRLSIDLPEDFSYDANVGDPALKQSVYQATSQKLRLLQAIRDAQQTRQAVSSLTAGAISAAVETVAQEAQRALAQVDSKLNDLAADLSAMRQSGGRPQGPVEPPLRRSPLRQSTKPGAPPTPGHPGLRRVDREMHAMKTQMERLALRVGALEQQLQPAGEAVDRRASARLDRMAGDIAELKAIVEPLNRYVSHELKRQMADYVNAFSQARAIAEDQAVQGTRRPGAALTIVHPAQ